MSNDITRDFLMFLNQKFVYDLGIEMQAEGHY